MAVPPLSKFGLETSVKVIPYRIWSQWTRSTDATKNGIYIAAAYLTALT
jgi:hypothetical protein